MYATAIMKAILKAQELEKPDDDFGIPSASFDKMHFKVTFLRYNYCVFLMFEKNDNFDYRVLKEIGIQLKLKKRIQ